MTGTASQSSRLDVLFRPENLAIVGATEKAPWTHAIHAAAKAYGFTGELYAVNREGRETLGMPGFTSCVAIGKPVDTAYLIVPVRAMKEAMADVIAAGVKSAVILTSGFAETGAEGRALQDEVLQMAREAEVSLVGPNSLGFVNIADRAPVTSIPPVMPIIDGSVAVISQSGATAYELTIIAQRQGIGLSFLAATGNEADVGIAEIVDWLVDHAATKVIAVYAETIHNAPGFAKAALRALAAGKPIVILKVGRSELTAAVAAAHTGSMVGDDRVFDAACARYGMVRVKSMEDLIGTAGFLATTGAIERPGVGVISISGGACSMIADLGEGMGVQFPAFAPETVTELRKMLPDYAATLNPFDITGAAIAAPQMLEDALQIVGRDPSIGTVFFVYSLPRELGMQAVTFQKIASGLEASPVPAFFWNQSVMVIDEATKALLDTTGIKRTVFGLEAGLQAVSGAVRWSEQRKTVLATAEQPVALESSARPTTERATLDVLSSHGVPVIPATLATSAAEARAAADAAGGPVVLKIASPDILHKTEVGGVKLNIAGGDAAAEAYDAIIASARKAKPDAQIEGVIVSPMRGGGVELLAGVARDPNWGPVLAVGLGGVWVEVLQDSALALLPVTPAKVAEMLRGLRGAKLLEGYRGAPPVNIEAAAEAIAEIGNAALALGPDLAALEVNPLLAFDGKVEALDGIAIWQD